MITKSRSHIYTGSALELILREWEHVISFADGLPPQKAINAELSTFYDFMCNTCIIHYISGEGCRAKSWQLHSHLEHYFENWSVDRRRELHLIYNEYEKYAWYIGISYEMIIVWDAASAFTRLPSMFLWNFFSRKKRLDKLPRTFFISNLQTKLRMISSSVPGLATDTPWDIGGLG